jgi:hypothetical protein
VPAARTIAAPRRSWQLEAAGTLRHAATEADAQQDLWPLRRDSHSRPQSPGWESGQRLRREQAYGSQGRWGAQHQHQRPAWHRGARPGVEGARGGSGYYVDPAAIEQHRLLKRHHNASQDIIAIIYEANSSGQQAWDLPGLANRLRCAMQGYSTPLPSGALQLRPTVLRALLGPCLDQLAQQGLAKAPPPAQAGGSGLRAAAARRGGGRLVVAA